MTIFYEDDMPPFLLRLSENSLPGRYEILEMVFKIRRKKVQRP
jgi:hypothetical protein